MVKENSKSVGDFDGEFLMTIAVTFTNGTITVGLVKDISMRFVHFTGVEAKRLTEYRNMYQDKMLMGYWC
jgi:hypothetical protein